MPLNSRGSVSARFRVWLSRDSAARKALRSHSRTSIPPRAKAASPSSPATRCREARFFDPASVRSSVPVSKSNAASPSLPGIFAPGAFQCSRPAIMRWITRWRSPSSPRAIRLPIRRSATRARLSAARRGGSTVRSTNGLRIRIASSRRPRIRSPSASRYTTTSGSSGMAGDYRKTAGGWRPGTCARCPPAVGESLAGRSALGIERTLVVSRGALAPESAGRAARPAPGAPRRRGGRLAPLLLRRIPGIAPLPSRRRPLPKRPLNLRHENAQAERLRQKTEGALRQRALLDFGPRESGDEYHRHVGEAAPYRGEQREPVQVGHLPVDHENVRAVADEVDDGGERVARRPHDVAFLPQRFVQERAHRVVVLDDEDPRLANVRVDRLEQHLFPRAAHHDRLRHRPLHVASNGASRSDCEMRARARPGARSLESLRFREGRRSIDRWEGCQGVWRGATIVAVQATSSLSGRLIPYCSSLR